MSQIIIEETGIRIKWNKTYSFGLLYFVKLAKSIYCKGNCTIADLRYGGIVGNQQSPHGMVWIYCMERSIF